MKKFLLSVLFLFNLLFVYSCLDILEPNDDKGGGAQCVDIDGNEYKTVKIGDQWWMAENLKVKRYRNGEDISDCWSYDNNDINAIIYGRLYSWFAVSDTRNIAPEGWHVPTDLEWKELEMALGMSQFEANKTGYRGTNEGSKLAGSLDLWADDLTKTLQNNAEFGTSGFIGLPAGFYQNGGFHYMGYYTYFWSSSDAGGNYASCRHIRDNNTELGRRDNNKNYGYSVRCVKD